MKRVDKAYQGFFRRIKIGEKSGFPRFQGQHRYNSFTYPDHNNWKLEGNKLRLNNIGSLKIKLHREIAGTVKTCTIKRDGRHWYALFHCEIKTQHQKRTPYTDDAVGVDLGLYHFATLDTGDIIDNPRYYRQAEQKLAKAQQVLARKKRGSERRKKAAQRVAKHHRKIRNQRQNFLHRWSKRLVNTYKTIVFEDLEPSKMSRAPKPKQDEEGKYLPNGASKKAGLNKSILDAGWSTFITMCEYKAACAGTVQVVRVDPYKTSQVCSGCLKEGPHKDLSERVHTCKHCGLVLDRDVNAAKNILAVWQGLNLRPTPKKTRARARTEPTRDAPV